MIKNQNNFSVIGGVLILAAFCLLIFMGWMAWHQSRSTQKGGETPKATNKETLQKNGMYFRNKYTKDSDKKAASPNIMKHILRLKILQKA